METKNILSESAIREAVKEFFHDDKFFDDEINHSGKSFNTFLTFLSEKSGYEDLKDLFEKLSEIERLKFSENLLLEEEKLKSEEKKLRAKIKVNSKPFQKPFWEELNKTLEIPNEIYQEELNEQSKHLKSFDKFLEEFDKIYYSEGAYFISKECWKVEKIAHSDKEKGDSLMDIIINKIYTRIMDNLKGNLVYNDHFDVTTLPNSIDKNFVIRKIKEVIPFINIEEIISENSIRIEGKKKIKRWKKKSLQEKFEMIYNAVLQLIQLPQFNNKDFTQKDIAKKSKMTETMVSNTIQKNKEKFIEFLYNKKKFAELNKMEQEYIDNIENIITWYTKIISSKQSIRISNSKKELSSGDNHASDENQREKHRIRQNELHDESNKNLDSIY